MQTGLRLAMSALGLALGACAPLHAEVAPPAPYGALPTPRQVRHAEREFYAFCHFTVDTFTDKEWGGGDEKPAVFNPTQFNANQIVAALKAAGCKGFILTCKHHDGFCLWPTKATPHNVSASPYKNGRGDIVRECADACKQAGLEFGVYLSPWDRNNVHYGKPEYVTDVYRKQLTELLTNYGPVFEVWFDGANGGSGYYGGQRGRRNIDRTHYYDWSNTWALIREHQPNAIMFSDVGPDVRWCGNEHGSTSDPCRATITYEAGAAPGHLNESKLGSGELHGKVWCPAEVDVSIRPGWFWHERQNKSVRSPENLMHIYLQSVGHGATLNLNVPPDRRGLLHEIDVESLKIFGDHLRQTFATNLAAGAKLQASNVRGGEPAYGPEKLLDADRWSAWVTDDPVHTPEVVLNLDGEKTFNLIRLREDIRLGQRVEGVAVDAWVDGQWKQLAQAQAIGACRLWRVPRTTTDKVRIRVTQSPVAPALSDFGLYLEPAFDPWISPAANPKMAYKRKWKVVSKSYEAAGGEATHAIDGDPNTLWHTHNDDGEHKPPHEIVIDLSKTTALAGFTYLPRHDGTTRGIVDQYQFYISNDGKTWGPPAAQGEFGNIVANPIEQTVMLPKPVSGRFFKFVALHSANGNHITVAELGIVEAAKK